MTKGLPPGWRIANVGEIAENVTVRVDPAEAETDVYVGLEHLDPESLHLRQWGTPADVTGQKFVFKIGDIIFGRRRAYQRKLAVAHCDGICSAHAMVLRAKPKVVLPEFLPFFLQSDMFMERAIGISVGSLSPTINWNDMKAQEFPLPPIEEQRRIAELLWAADDTLERHCEVLQASQLLMDSILDDFLHGGVTQGKRRTKPLWPQYSCRELLSAPPRNGLSPEVNAEGRGYPTLSIGCIRDGAVVIEGNLKYAEVSKEGVTGYLLRGGDLLVVRGNGNRQLVGRCGLVASVPLGCFYPDLLIRLCFDDSKLLPAFACAQWNHPSVHGELLKKAKSTNGIYKINGKDILDHRLAVPSLKEQEKLLERIQRARTSRNMIVEMLEATRRLKSCLANSLLTKGMPSVQ